MTYRDDKDKHIGYANAKSKRRIYDKLEFSDLADQLNSLQKAFAQERGEWERFREEVRTHLRIRSSEQPRGY